MTQRTIAIVPARMASSRFPGKPLVSIDGLPMIEHIRRRAALARGIDDVIVATCDDTIRAAVVAAGGKVAMTATTHERCTERVEEAARAIAADIVVIVQGDEPLLLPESVERVVQPLKEDANVQCTNLVSSLESDADFTNANIVKAACDQRGNILFLSRAPIPHFQRRTITPTYRQTGIMAFRAPFLHQYATLAETPFERAEGIDMMRLLEHGYQIRAVVVPYGTIGVDRAEDVAVVLAALRHDAVQSELHARITRATA
jgi:3-deoxy-manno-octulosonate cytidylyltransferase (CMP-KDO synthetase)